MMLPLCVVFASIHCGPLDVLEILSPDVSNAKELKCQTVLSCDSTIATVTGVSYDKCRQSWRVVTAAVTLGHVGVSRLVILASFSCSGVCVALNDDDNTGRWKC